MCLPARFRLVWRAEFDRLNVVGGGVGIVGKVVARSISRVGNGTGREAWAGAPSFDPMCLEATGVVSDLFMFMSPSLISCLASSMVSRQRVGMRA